MKKIYFLLTLAAWATATAFAQNLPAPKANSKLTGIVLDSLTGNPIEFANLSLVEVISNKPVNGAVCDTKGLFSMNRLVAGEYKLLVSFLGYRGKTVDKIKIGNKDDINIGTIRLSADVKKLDEVTVQGQKDLVEDKVDRLVYHAEKDITNTGGTAIDVMKKVPMLSVDLDGNVQMRGSSNIKVLINNKPSSIMARSIADALKAMPADMIKSVEVITSPSAKYDAEGTAGIINIITKKQLQGFNGSVSVSAGNRNNNMNTNLNYRIKKFGATFGGWGGLYKNIGYSEMNRKNFADNKVISELIQNSNIRSRGGNSSGNFGLDYDLDSLSRISVEGSFWRGVNHNHNWVESRFQATENILSRYNRDVLSDYNYGNFDSNISYSKTYKTPGKEFNILTQFNRDHNDNDYVLDQFSAEVIDYREKNFNRSRNQEFTFQTDYTHPFKNKHTLEIGAKAIIRDVKSDFQLANAYNATQPLADVPERSSLFTYQQQVWSSFAVYKFITPQKWSFNLGTRYEYTDLTSDFISSNTSFQTNYDNLIPSFTIAKDIQSKDKTQTHKIKFGYTQRIQRPYIFFLNPYVNYSDPKNLSFGNPYLTPELAHSFELGYNTSFKSNSVNASLYWRQTNNAIERITTVDAEGISRSTFQNISRNAAYGLSLSGNARPTTKMQINGNLNLGYYVLNSPVLQATNANWSYRVFMNFSQQFGKGFTFQINGNYQSPRVRLQGRQAGWYWYGVGLKKELFKKKGGITLGMDNFLNQYNQWYNELSSSTFKSESRSFFASRNIRLSFNWQFGKISADSRSKKKIANDDKKSGE